MYSGIDKHRLSWYIKCRQGALGVQPLSAASPYAIAQRRGFLFYADSRNRRDQQQGQDTKYVPGNLFPHWPHPLSFGGVRPLTTHI